MVNTNVAADPQRVAVEVYRDLTDAAHSSDYSSTPRSGGRTVITGDTLPFPLPSPPFTSLPS